MSATDSATKRFTLRDAQGMWWLLHEEADTSQFSKDEKSVLGQFFFEMQMLDTCEGLMHHNLSVLTGSRTDTTDRQMGVLDNLQSGGDLLDPYQPLFQQVLLLAKKVRPAITEGCAQFLRSQFDYGSWVREELGL